MLKQLKKWLDEREDQNIQRRNLLVSQAKDQVRELNRTISNLKSYDVSIDVEDSNLFSNKYLWRVDGLKLDIRKRSSYESL